MEWKNKKERKPLIVLGQRQIGKTYIIKKFANKEYSNSVYINFLESFEYKLIFKNLNGIDDLINRISIKFNLEHKNLEDTLFFLDEIEECNEAITFLKIINESKKRINIICSGSYLGYNINSSYVNFPIGQVEILYMKQIMFDEFIQAIGKEKILEEAKKSILNKSEINTIYHEELLKWFHHYLIIGVFPEVVKKFIENNFAYLECFKELKYIHLGYLNDINKYSQLFKSKTFLNLIYSNINNFLIKENKKFVFQEIDRNSKYRELERYIIWLNNSNLILKINNLKNIQYPLINQTTDNYFKHYYNDHGFFSLNYNLNNNISSENFNKIKGSLMENFVATQIYKTFSNIYYYYYYSFIKNGKRYEVDFVLENKNSECCLVEVKSSNLFKIKSLNEIHNSNKYVLSLNNYKIHNNYIEIPIYMSFMLDKIIYPYFFYWFFSIFNLRKSIRLLIWKNLLLFVNKQLVLFLILKTNTYWLF